MSTTSLAADPAETAELIVTWSGVVLAGFALLVSVLTVLFVAAGFVGIRELRSIRQSGDDARRELEQHKALAADIVGQAERAVAVAEELSTEANRLITRVHEALVAAEEQSEQVRRLNQDMRERLNDFDDRLSTQVEVSYLFNQGEAAYRDGEYEKSAEYLRRAVQLDPKHPRVRYRLGRSLTNLGEDAAAARELRAALDHKLPADAGERALALLYRYAQPDQAKTHAETAIDIDPGNPHNWNVLGLIRRDNGDFTGARDAHQRANQLDDELVTSPFYLALLAAEAHALPHARDRSADAMARLEASERRAKVKPLWAALIRWADQVLRGSYAEAEQYTRQLDDACRSKRRAREVCDHMEFLLRSLGREEYRERYIAPIERRWLENHH